VVAGALETPSYIYRLVVLRALRPNTAYAVAHRVRRGDLVDEADVLLTLAGPTASHRYELDRVPHEDNQRLCKCRSLARQISHGPGQFALWF
jgi:hypothetical protein